MSTTPLVRVRDILVNECWVTCPSCGHVNIHTVGPPGAPIAARPWGHRGCDAPAACAGYRIVPSEDVKIHTTLALFKKAGGMPRRWRQINMKMWKDSRGAPTRDVLPG
jgi:hypothetical protein